MAWGVHPALVYSKKATSRPGGEGGGQPEPEGQAGQLKPDGQGGLGQPGARTEGGAPDSAVPAAGAAAGATAGAAAGAAAGVGKAIQTGSRGEPSLGRAAQGRVVGASKA